MSGDPIAIRHDLRSLTAKLIDEYTGQLPAGRVVRVVSSSARGLYRVGVRGPSVVALCEQVSRNVLDTHASAFSPRSVGRRTVPA
ncbi:hypothetical protein [Flindersiella endophytica]